MTHPLIPKCVPSEEPAEIGRRAEQRTDEALQFHVEFHYHVVRSASQAESGADATGADHSRSRRLDAPRDKPRLRDLARVRQLSDEAEPVDERVQQLSAETDGPQGIIPKLHLNHVEI